MPPAARPIVVFVTHHLPWPAYSGGRVREAQLLQRLSAHFDIEVVAVSKVPELDRNHVAEATHHGVRARVFAAVDCGDTRLGPLTRRHDASTARKHLTHRLKDPHVVIHVEGHYLLRLMPDHLRRSALLVEHNVESTLFEQQAALHTTPTQRAALLQDGARTRRDELAAWRQVHTIGAVTEEDTITIRSAVPNADVRCLPNGADHLGGKSLILDATRRESAHLLFVAALGYSPNVHAARLLVADIFPEILRRCPDATLAIVGSGPPEWLREAAYREPRLTVTGWVPDVAPWLDAAQVVVCPLVVGGGVKVKVLEALARGCAIVATPIALQGLRHLPPNAVVERASASAFADACVRLLGSPREREQQRARAAQAARYLPSWDLAANAVADAWREHVLVVGGGDQRAALEALAQRLRLGKRVTFTGLVADVTPALIAMDVLVQASDTEGTPRTVLEAMAHHVPVVATNVGDVAELLDQGRCGELVPPGDAGPLAQAIERLLADPTRVRNLTGSARSRYQDRYTIEAMRRRVDEAYRTAHLVCARGRQP